MQPPTITVVGYVGAPPRKRTTPNGVAVTDFRIANTPSRRDATGAWTDRETMWFTVSAWRGLADHCFASLTTGDRVVVTGRLGTSSWTAEGGETRTVWEVDAATVGLELTRWTATAQRPPAGVASPSSTDDGPDVAFDPVTGEVEPDGADDALQPAA